MVTTLHFHLLGLVSTLDTVGGFHNFTQFPQEKIVLSDSGGFQVLSLINRKGLGKITEEGALFKDPKTGRKTLLSPELSLQIQHSICSDIRTALDVPLMGNEDNSIITKALEQTTRWAQRSKTAYLASELLTPDEFIATKPKLEENTLSFERPLLNAVVQGGNDLALRKESAQQLSAIGFDLFGFGGWPVDENGKLQTKVLETFVENTPPDSLKYGMGIGTPDDIVTCISLGIKLFDCVLPSRNARHGSLFVTKGSGEKAGKNYDLIRIKNARYQFDSSKLDPACSCPTCKHYSRAYLRFLIKNNNPVGYSLLTLHNIWWYQNFILEISP